MNHQPAAATASRRAAPSPSLPSTRLLSSALVGVVGAGGLAGCTKSANPVDCAAPTYNNTITGTPTNPIPADLAEFTARCDARGGFVQTHAWCAGANSCKGLSLSFGVLTDHSCKGMNTCEGFSCVDGVTDKGLTGASIYATSCKGCHGDGKFVVLARAGSAAERLAAFQATTPENALRLLSVVAFGTQGQNANGTGYANMPIFRQQLSRPELQRVVDYARALPAEAAEYVAW